MKLLALSTSTPRGSAALLSSGDTGPEPLGTAAYGDLQGHAERIFEAIDAVLAAAGVDRAAIGAIGCDIGPGSFTGVRVGLASAKGIALALDLPLAGVTSLEAMAAAAFAEGAAGPDDLVVAAVDAKKSEIFLAAYDAVGRVIAPPAALPAVPASFVLGGPAAGRRVVIVGEIAAQIGVPEGTPLARGPALDLPDAAWIGRLALARVLAGEAGDAAALEPLYVRAPDATPSGVLL